MIENWNPNGNFLFTEEEFNKVKSRDLLPLKCLNCGKIFYKSKHYIQSNSCKFCSLQCKGKNKTLNGTILVKCEQCGKEFRKCKCNIKKSNHNFCSQNCAGKYYNDHKTTGFNRSKLELYLEKLLTKLYDFEIKFNEREILPSHLELDIYIPSLKLAFEINGIVHYEPIYGKEKFNNILNKDLTKYNECKELGIELFDIDISEYTKYIFDFYIKFCNEIVDIINKRSYLNKSFTKDELEQIINNTSKDIKIIKEKGFYLYKNLVPNKNKAEDIAYKVNKIIDSDIDFNKIGWVSKVSDLIGIRKNKGRKWMKCWCPWLLKNTYKRNSGVV